MNDHNVYQTNNSETEETPEQAQQEREKEMQDDEEELHKLLLPNVHDLPLTPPSAIDFNFVAYFAPDFLKPGHDQYVYRHANGLCVIGLAPTHVAFKDEGGITAVDFNVGKSDRSGFKVTGKRKKADREGYIAIIMPKPADWLKIKSSLLGLEDYKRKREECFGSS
ncbi:actin-binding transcription modulator [Citrus sinensis]|uniref:Actin-binding transcription modulator n=1 Tax=Citrus sinensis TaxID=2711 RepID=A0ACB8KXY9_CITSI|nr:actin-binding transcription modulator [Citrus sinensis]